VITKAELPYLLAAFWGFLGAFVYATFKARMVLCSGDRDPTRGERRRAWGEYLASLPTGAILAGALTPSLAHLLPWLNFVGASAVIGLLANPAMPVVVDFLSEGVRKKLGDVLTDLGAAISKQKGTTA
jgi:MFS family permease